VGDRGAAWHVRIVNRLNTETNAALADAKIKERFAAMGALLLGGTPDGFRKLISDETEKWGKVIKFAGISAG
jgi:tripartite-type tricarboxylate transporter receptor subunit TctC